MPIFSAFMRAFSEKCFVYIAYNRLIICVITKLVAPTLSRSIPAYCRRYKSSRAFPELKALGGALGFIKEWPERSDCEP